MFAVKYIMCYFKEISFFLLLNIKIAIAVREIENNAGFKKIYDNGEE